MNRFPKRPESHVTENRAVQAFVTQCDPAWIVSPVVKDYGLDLRVRAKSGVRVLFCVRGRQNHVNRSLEIAL